MSTALQIAYLLLMPALGFWLAQRSRLAARLGPVVFAYLFGLLLSQLPINDTTISSSLRDLSIPLAIPLLLFGLNVPAWLRGARATVISFGLCLVALLVVSTLAHFLFAGRLAYSAEIAGMLTGLYSGGSPNMAVVHSALGTPDELFVQVNAIDFLTGAVYFLFLITLAGPVYGRILGRSAVPVAPPPVMDRKPGRWRDAGLAILVSLGIVAVTAAVVKLITGRLDVAPVMLGITSLGIAASFWKRLHRIGSSYGMGYYLVTVFCCALGSQLKLDQLGSGLAMIAAMHLGILVGTIALHLMLARLARIDRDTAIITQTASLYGPPFVPPVASALNNPAMLLSGLTTGLVGYAVGNYLGIGLALVLR